MMAGMDKETAKKFTEAIQMLNVSFQHLLCQVKTLEEAVVKLGIAPETLRERFHELWLKRQVQAEGRIGAAAAAQLYSILEDHDHDREHDHPTPGSDQSGEVQP